MLIHAIMLFQIGPVVRVHSLGKSASQGRAQAEKRGDREPDDRRRGMRMALVEAGTRRRQGPHLALGGRGADAVERDRQRDDGKARLQPRADLQGAQGQQHVEAQSAPRRSSRR